MPQSLVEKLAEVVRGMDGVAKEGRADQGFTYLRILDLADALRERLFAAGILIIPSDVECVVERSASTITDREWTQATVKTRFEITDGVEEWFFDSYGFARDLDGYAVATAQTMALKSLLKRLALVFGERDDPGREDQLGYDLDLNEGEQKWGSDLREWPISRHEVISLNAAAQSSGYSKKTWADYLDASFGVSKPSDLKRRFLAQAMDKALAKCGVTGETA
jgi:hypothetical protein